MRERIDRLFAIALLLGTLGLIATWCTTGCGATPREQHEALNTITDAADPTYELAVDTCGEAFEHIVEREGTTYEQDVDAIAEIDRVCAPIVAGFEVLRGTQRTAREAIDSGITGAVLAGIQEALAAWARLRELLPELRTLGTSTGGES